MNSIDELLKELEKEPMTESRRKRLKLYKEENARFKESLAVVKLMHEYSPFDSPIEKDPDWVEALKTLRIGQQYFETSECSAEAMALSHIEKESKDNTYIKSLKSDIQLYMGFNAEVEKDIETFTRQLEEAKKHFKDALCEPKDIHLVDKKIASYSNELEKFEKKHPWLKNPQIDLTYIAKEAEMLASMLEEKEAMEKEFKAYQGLAPDVHEASRQLSDLKKEYNKLREKYHSNKH
ncbi:uncharacterized protein LOC123672492 isoform X1 [Harmonia axyridis]|uniref:uncharacterized protein LOC123672492 isoform X1 n=2 Tax=Harmonia axyridis TaxID=115357 RepID=UPI001E276B87|nr:uncharacterized protein LOC123672492 isoform X1 [Harmonia axyridis]